MTWKLRPYEEIGKYVHHWPSVNNIFLSLEKNLYPSPRDLIDGFSWAGTPPKGGFWSRYHRYLTQETREDPGFEAFKRAFYTVFCVNDIDIDETQYETDIDE